MVCARTASPQPRHTRAHHSRPPPPHALARPQEHHPQRRLALQTHTQRPLPCAPTHPHARTLHPLTFAHSPLPPHARANARRSTTPSGALTLDLALGGGYPKGRVVEIYGPESSGKTTLALHAMAEVQRAGGAVALIDAEHAFDPVFAKVRRACSTWLAWLVGGGRFTRSKQTQKQTLSSSFSAAAARSPRARMQRLGFAHKQA